MSLPPDQQDFLDQKKIDFKIQNERYPFTILKIVNP
jgi:hypothetical protein